MEIFLTLTISEAHLDQELDMPDWSVWQSQINIESLKIILAHIVSIIYDI